MSWNVIKTERNSSSLRVVCHLSKKFFKKDFKSYILKTLKYFQNKKYIPKIQ